MVRVLDILFFIYFVTHIPITILVDTQALIPREYYPKQLLDLKDWYCTTFRDNLMISPPTWFWSFAACECLIQLPFFFVASYGYFKGASKCQWLRIPVIIYGSHVATTLIPILAHLLFHDFTKDKNIGPRNLNERLSLMSFYLPYFVVPIVLVLDAIFSPAYTQFEKSTEGGKSSRSKKVKVKAY